MNRITVNIQDCFLVSREVMIVYVGLNIWHQNVERPLYWLSHHLMFKILNTYLLHSLERAEMAALLRALSKCEMKTSFKSIAHAR